jgi:hypothetical protein
MLFCKLETKHWAFSNHDFAILILTTYDFFGSKLRATSDRSHAKGNLSKLPVASVNIHAKGNGSNLRVTSVKIHA